MFVQGNINNLVSLSPGTNFALEGARVPAGAKVSLIGTFTNWKVRS